MSDQFTRLDVYPDIDAEPWIDIRQHHIDAHLERIGLLAHGTDQGAASVALLARLDDGTPVLMQTTWAIFNTAARALAASPIAQQEQ